MYMPYGTLRMAASAIKVMPSHRSPWSCKSDLGRVGCRIVAGRIDGPISVRAIGITNRAVVQPARNDAAENEFYGTIRPKRVIRSDERPPQAPRWASIRRGLTMNSPIKTVGINATTMRFRDVFLLHCGVGDRCRRGTRQTEIATRPQPAPLTATWGHERT